MDTEDPTTNNPPPGLIAAEWIGTGPLMGMFWISLNDVRRTLAIRFLFVIGAGRFFFAASFLEVSPDLYCPVADFPSGGLSIGFPWA